MNNIPDEIGGSDPGSIYTVVAGAGGVAIGVRPILFTDNNKTGPKIIVGVRVRAQTVLTDVGDDTVSIEGAKKLGDEHAEIVSKYFKKLRLVQKSPLHSSASLGDFLPMKNPQSGEDIDPEAVLDSLTENAKLRDLYDSILDGLFKMIALSEKAAGVGVITVTKTKDEVLALMLTGIVDEFNRISDALEEGSGNEHEGSAKPPSSKPKAPPKPTFPTLTLEEWNAELNKLWAERKY